MHGGIKFDIVCKGFNVPVNQIAYVGVSDSASAGVSFDGAADHPHRAISKRETLRGLRHCRLRRVWRSTGNPKFASKVLIKTP